MGPTRHDPRGRGRDCYTGDVVVVSLVTIALDPRDTRAVLVMQDARGRTLPIWVDDEAAVAVAAAARGTLQTLSPPALLVAALEACGGALLRVELGGLHDGALRAVVVVLGAYGEVELSARPSLAIAAALVQGCPIVTDPLLLAHVDERVVEAAARMQAAVDARSSAVDEPPIQSTAERWNALLEHLKDRLVDERPS